MRHRSETYVLRENTGTSGVIKTARAAAATLGDHDIPHLVIGGIAVQEHGYVRTTIAVDLVVPDVLEAVEFVTADLGGPFIRVPGCEDRVEDRTTGVKVDLLPAGRVVKRGCKIPFPQPGKPTDSLQIVGLSQLISLKLDSWSVSPMHRHKDKTDVIELILRRKLPRDFEVAAPVRELYHHTWDALQAES